MMAPTSPSKNPEPKIAESVMNPYTEGLSCIKPGMLMSDSGESSATNSKKATAAAKLVKLTLIDPKQARKIWVSRL